MRVTLVTMCLMPSMLMVMASPVVLAVLIVLIVLILHVGLHMNCSWVAIVQTW